MKISIITPSFRQLDWLRICARSVRRQRAQSHGIAIEHIIQDAGTDGIREFAAETGAILHEDGAPVEAVGGTDANLRIHVEADQGMYDAINRGVAKATGEVCAWLNCDEQYLPGAIAAAAAEFDADPRMELLAGGAVVFEPDGSYRCHRPGVIPTYAALARHHLTVQSCAIFFRRDLFDKRYLFDPTWRGAGDRDWFLRMLKGVVVMRGTARYLGVYMETGENLSMDPEMIRTESARMKSGHPVPRSLSRLAWALHKLRVLSGFLRHPPPKEYEIEIPSRRTGDLSVARVRRATLRWRRKLVFYE